MSANILTVTDSSFEADVLGSDLPVLVDFWAEWCGPCKMIAPVLEEIAVEYAGKLKVVKVNVDDSPGTAARFDARSIPTLVILKDGAVVDRIIGAQPKGALAAVIDKALAAA